MRDKTAVRHYAIGSAVRCGDGDCGRLERVIIEPIGRTLTHLLIQPSQRHRPGRLVPVEAVETPEHADIEIVLNCSLAEFEAFEPARPAQFLHGASGQWSYEQDQMLSWPYYRLGAVGAAEYAGVPLEEVHVRRGEHLHATDGALGRVQGLIIDRDDHCVTHVLLDEGHIWGQKRAAIPVNALLVADGAVRVNLTRREVRDLPPVEIDAEE